MQCTKDLCSFVSEPFRRPYIKDYLSRMSKDNLNELWDDHVATVLKEQGFNPRSHPRSIYKVEDLFKALARFAPSNAPKVNIHSQDIQAGIRLARMCFSKPKDEDYITLSAFTPAFIHAITSNPSGSAGLTAWGQTKAESEVVAFERGLEIIQGRKRAEPCLAFKRTQFESKTRLIWGYPYSMTALEGLFARPLIERFKGGNTPMAFGMSSGVLGSKLRVSSYHKTYAYSTDVKSYDASIAASLISVAFQILQSWFDLNEVEPTSKVQYVVIWNMVVGYFIHTPIVMPDGNIYKGKRHGVPSGSYFTQLIDSVINVIIVGAISYHFHLDVSSVDIFVLGDDVLFWSNRLVKLEHIADYASRTFNMRFNADKSQVFRFNEPIHYLGRIWNKGIPTLEVEDILDRMTQPESYRKYPKEQREVARRVRMLLLSYAAVYKDAYQIYLRCVDTPNRWVTTNSSIENYVYNEYDKSGTYGYEQNPDDLSGLQRYLLKYIISKNQSLGVSTPLALQFWK